MQKIENLKERHRHWKMSLLEIIRSQPGISRTELKRISRLSMESVLGLVDELLEEQLITDCGAREIGKAGRKASGLRINPDGCYFIGVRFSASAVDCTCTNFSHELLDQCSKELPLLVSTAVMLEAITDGISFLLDRLGEKRKLVRGIGIGAPGLIDPENGIIRRYVHVIGCKNWPLRQLLQDRFHIPVYLEHGVKCSASAFFRQEENKEIRDALYVQVGRGVNMSILSDGRIMNGAGYLSGEIGHMPVSGCKYRCSCERIGCLETVAGSAALHALVRKEMLERESAFPILRDLLNHGQPLFTATVFQAAESGDPDCIRLLEQAGRALGSVLASAVMIVNPARIIISSKLDRCSVFTEACEAALRANTFSESMENTAIRFLPSDPIADAIGAAGLPCRALFENPIG